MSQSSAKFHVGQLVHHKLFDYRGVVIDVDAGFTGASDDALRKAPPRRSMFKEVPWYHVLVDDAQYRTYVAERNLEPDPTGRPIRHPEVPLYFEGLSNDAYVPRRKGN